MEMKCVTQNKLLKQLDLLLQESYPETSERDSRKEFLLKKLERENFVKLFLPNHTCIILSKDERKLNRSRRYENSPLPLLSNIEFFSNSIGTWNSALQEYGIKARHKHKDLHSKGTSGLHVYMLRCQSINKQSNEYLLRQYKRLRKYKERKEITKY